ncbi:ABC transporter substrate-binding protein [Kaarinaea lacus]
MKKFPFLALACVALITICLISPSVSAKTTRVAVLYPNVASPYNAVFDQIINGIKSQSGIHAETLAIDKDFNLQQIHTWITKRNADVLIALGQRGMAVVDKLSVDIPVVASAVLYLEEPQIQTTTGISLTPDPKLLFTQLKQLAPEVKRVFVVYNPERFTWLMGFAKTAARQLNLTIVTEAAKDLKASAQLYRQIIDNSNPNTDAVWLLQDASTVGDTSLLPFILKQAWHKKLIVFSSNPGHVRRGALFSLYANRDALGKSVAKLAQKTVSGVSTDSKFIPLQDVGVAVNLRTASHIDLNISYEQQRQFNVVYPKR